MTGVATSEDRRAAANIVASLSSYLITAALTIIGAQAAIVTYIIDKREKLACFYGVSGVALVFLVTSVILGGRGMAEIYKKGYAGDWIIKTSKGAFNLQTLSCLLGAILVAASVFLGATKEDRPSESTEYLQLRSEVANLKSDFAKIKGPIDTILKKSQKRTSK